LCQLDLLVRAFTLPCHNYLSILKLCELETSNNLALSLPFDFAAVAEWMLLRQSVVAFCEKCLISLLSLMCFHTEFERAER
jgi:hypothetical protein